MTWTGAAVVLLKVTRADLRAARGVLWMGAPAPDWSGLLRSCESSVNWSADY